MTEETTQPEKIDAELAEPKVNDSKKKGKTHTRIKKAAKVKRQVSRGCAYIKTSYNNTIVTFTDMNGDVLAWSSAGNRGFAGPKKSTPYAAAQIVRDVVEKVQVHGVKEVFVYLRGVGSGRESAIRTINAGGISIIGIKDVTPIPHNGPRAKKPRRV